MWLLPVIFNIAFDNELLHETGKSTEQNSQNLPVLSFLRIERMALGNKTRRLRFRSNLYVTRLTFDATTFRFLQR